MMERVSGKREKNIEKEITKMSCKGQIVVPKSMREKLDINDGDSFVVANYKDLLILKKVQANISEEEIQKAVNLKNEDEVKSIESLRRSYIC